tara:strand:+ start:354 stop:560 length:207 start_codon:yes stop_codon:yes gene_type:complete
MITLTEKELEFIQKYLTNQIDTVTPKIQEMMLSKNSSSDSITKVVDEVETMTIIRDKIKKQIGYRRCV